MAKVDVIEEVLSEVVQRNRQANIWRTSPVPVSAATWSKMEVSGQGEGELCASGFCRGAEHEASS